MSRLSELRAFVTHLRWHYQVLILPAGYLLGGLYQPDLNLERFAVQFLNVHLLLNGGVTAYNSYWDKDEGPIGGLAHPPPMRPWMLWASLLLQFIGAAFALPLGLKYFFIYLLTMALSVAYSRPRPRWKGHPLLSLVAVGIGTGTNTFLLGYLAGGNQKLTGHTLLAAAGVALMLLSLYPISQIYQLEADKKNSDRTFAAAYGIRGVRTFFVAAFTAGAIIVAATLQARSTMLAAIFAVLGIAGGIIIGLMMAKLRGESTEYKPVMRVKYFASLMFSAFITTALVLMNR